MKKKGGRNFQNDKGKLSDIHPTLIHPCLYRDLVCIGGGWTSLLKWHSPQRFLEERSSVDSVV